MNNIYLIGDTHFNHNNIIRYCNRPFKTEEEMNEALIHNWNETVPHDGIVIHVGDFGFGRYEDLHKIVKRLNGIKFLIKGNHDRFTKTKYRNMGFEEVFNRQVSMDEFAELGGIIPENKDSFIYTLTHFPKEELGEELKDNEINIFGHIHNQHDYLVRPPKTYCVSVERIQYRPIKFADLITGKK